MGAMTGGSASSIDGAEATEPVFDPPTNATAAAQGTGERLESTRQSVIHDEQLAFDKPVIGTSCSSIAL